MCICGQNEPQLIRRACMSCMLMSELFSRFSLDGHGTSPFSITGAATEQDRVGARSLSPASTQGV